jgi:hypothetical protein
VSGSLPGASLILPGANFGVHYRVSAVEIGIDIGTTLARTLQREAVSLSLRQSDLRAEWLIRIAAAERLALSIGADGGVRLLTRATARTASDQVATADRASWSALVGPIAQLHWQFAHSVGLALRIGVDFIPQPTRFSVQTDAGMQRHLARLAIAAPWAALALSVDIWE